MRVAAPTGCAAFNIRFGATTLHRLFHILNPFRWREFNENSQELAAFQEKMKALQLIILDEVSMIGKQMMGKISSRCRQAKTIETNPDDDMLGNLSFATVGDPAQCPPIQDTPFYDPNLHKDTRSDPDAQRVKLANTGHLAYDSFSDIIILQTCHRIRQKADTTDPESLAYNERGQRFLGIMNRLRDCVWNEEDYYWLCKRKLGQLSFSEKSSFADAPVIMEFRKERDDENPNSSCESHNRTLLFHLAKDKDVPVARFNAAYEGATCEEGAKYADDVFRGLTHQLEVCEEAPVLLTENMWVQAGLMNGTRGVIKAIVYRYGARPDHADPNNRVPIVLLVDCPDYVGEPFFDQEKYPDRTHWVPIFPRGIAAETEEQVTRTQLPIVLAWALTPWKAQGMSLEKVVVKIGTAASKPGVAFVALTRARHPDGLALDDDFPVFSTFQKQKQHRTFQLRQIFERRARVNFSRTIRKYMRDPACYTPAKVWSEKDAQLADDLLHFVQLNTALADADVVDAFVAQAGSDADHETDRIIKVWTRLTTEFPHMFAVASERGTLDELNLSGHVAANTRNTPQISFLLYDSWKTALAEVQEFVSDERMSPGTLGLLLQILQAKRTVPTTTAAVGNPYYMFQPDRHKARLQTLLDTSTTVLLPVYSGKAAAWVMCELARKTSTEHVCTIHHWHKHKHEALSKLEQDLRSYLNVSMCHRKVYQMRLPQTHMIVINVAAQKLLGRDELVAGGVDVPCDAPFATTHKKLRGFLEEIMIAAMRAMESDLRQVARTDESVKALLESLLERTALDLKANTNSAAEKLSNATEQPISTASAKAPASENALAQRITGVQLLGYVPRGKPLLKRRRFEQSDATDSADPSLSQQGHGTGLPAVASSPCAPASTTTASGFKRDAEMSQGSSNHEEKASLMMGQVKKPRLSTSSIEAPSEHLQSCGSKSLAPTCASSSATSDAASSAGMPAIASCGPFARATSSHDDKPRPFANLTCSCYINSGVMACFGVQAFREILVTVYEARKRRLDRHLLPAAVHPAVNIDLRIQEHQDPHTTHEERLAVTFKAAFEPKAGMPIVPRLFTNKFYDHNDHVQEDVMEFLLRSVLNSEEQYAPLLGNVCKGMDAPKLQCQQCTYHRGAAPEAFNMLPIPVIKNDGSLIHSVQEALHTYFDAEDVDVNWSCLNNTCPLYKVPNRRPNKFHRISVCPQVLILNLVRWQGIGAGLLHAVVPEREITLQHETYRLKSIVCHMGKTIRGGHYTCRIHFPTAAGTWWYYNDTERRLATEQELRTSDRERSYVLMYEKSNAVASVSPAEPLSRAQPLIEFVGLIGDIAPALPDSAHVSDAEDIEMESPPSAVPRASRLPGRSRPRIVTGFGEERVDDVAADEALRLEAGVRRAARRRDEGERGRVRDWDDNDLDRSTGAAWHAGRRK